MIRVEGGLLLIFLAYQDLVISFICIYEAFQFEPLRGFDLLVDFWQGVAIRETGFL